MAVRTLPLNWRSAHAGGSVRARRGDARRAAGQCLAAVALSAALTACGAKQSSDPAQDAGPLAGIAAAQPASPPIRAADCDATGMVANLPVDDFLAVRVGPGTNYREVARLDAGVAMHLCTPASNSRWIGIVYRPDGELPDAQRCQLTNDDSPRYEGPCLSGWVSARYVARKEVGSAVGISKDLADDKIPALDRLNDQLNEKFPTTKNQGFSTNYRSLGIGCQGHIKNEIYNRGGDKWEHVADFDYSKMVKVSEVHHNQYAEPDAFEFSVHLAPDESGSSRVKVSAPRDVYDTSSIDSIELALPTREAAEEVRETLLQLRSVCRAIKRKEQASMGIDQHRSGRDANPRFAAIRHYGRMG